MQRKRSKTLTNVYGADIINKRSIASSILVFGRSFPCISSSTVEREEFIWDSISCKPDNCFSLNVFKNFGPTKYEH